MPAVLNWFLRLLPTNPICIRIIQGGSRRSRQLMIRGAFLGVLILLMLMMLMLNFGSGSMSLRSLATSGSMIFASVSILQVLLVCLITPIFMAGAISHESNPRTWEILLTTPLNSLQIVLGNLFGRLFFVLALLVATLPLFMLLRYFGGVPGNAILGSFLIAASCAILVASIAVMLSVTRSGGRRAVFVFYVSVVLTLFLTWALDRLLRTPIPGGDGAVWTTIMTPLNPFLALEVLLYSNSYVPQDGDDVNWITRLWLARPVATFCWLCVLSSILLISFSTACVRIFSRNGGREPILRSMLGMSPLGAIERDPRLVGSNPVAWRESHRHSGNLGSLLTRWGFVCMGLLVMVVLLWLHNAGMMTVSALDTSIGFLVLAEICIVTLTALNLSATAVSREREDGSLDIILTTPIQPGPYLKGKHQGLVRYLLPLMLVPIGSILLAMFYVFFDGFGAPITRSVTTSSGMTLEVAFLLWPGAIAFTIMFIPFTAFCVMVGLLWSIRSRGTIGSVVMAVAIVGGLVAVLSLCAMPVMQSSPLLGPIAGSISPVNLILLSIDPAGYLPGSTEVEQGTTTFLLLLGGVIGCVIYGLLAIVLHRNMSRTFMMTVRQLSGQH